MSGLLERIYFSMPALRDMAATYVGHRLAAQRYGPVYYRELDAIRERADWPSQRMRDYVNEQFRRVVSDAAQYVPHYRDVFRRLGLSPSDIRTPADLVKLPVLTKGVVRAAGTRLLDERFDSRRLIRARTTGTTGTPLSLYHTRESVQINYAFLEERCRRPAGMRYGDLPYFMFGSQRVAPASRRRPPFWCYNHAFKQLYLSVTHLSARALPHYYDELLRRPYHAAMGLPAALNLLAAFILESGRPALQLQAVITNGETLHPHQRENISRAFGCAVRDQYGCSELTAFSFECRHGGMHLSPDYALIEVVDDEGFPVAPGERGYLVGTSLFSPAQPLIRYRIGDKASLATEPCSCGSPLPLLKEIGGREANVITTADGRQITRLCGILSGVEAVREVQVVQESLSYYQVQVVPQPEFREADAERIRRNLAMDIGEARLDVVTVDHIERGPGGKFQFMQSKIGAVAV